MARRRRPVLLCYAAAGAWSTPMLRSTTVHTVRPPGQELTVACSRHCGVDGSPAEVLRPVETVVFHPIGSEGVLLDLERGTYFGLNELGRAIWQQLATCCCLAELHDLLLVEYEVEPAQLWHDLTAYTEALLQHHLVFRQES